jgi:hypothetical protein
MSKCGDCKYFVTLHKHPWNSGEYKGSVLEPTALYACILCDNNTRYARIATSDDGECELFTEFKPLEEQIIKKTMSYGICKVCGCTDNNACIHPVDGACSWVDDSHEICSHCVDHPSSDQSVERQRPADRFRKLQKGRENLRIYIASSWKNQHAVEMLTTMLRAKGHGVVSWVENNYGEGHNHVTKNFDFETWVNTEASDQSFEFDTDGAKNCDLLIYVGPSGKDAAAECAMAWACGKPVIGLWAKGEDFGLMRKMFTEWYDRYPDLLEAVDRFKHINK